MAKDRRVDDTRAQTKGKKRTRSRYRQEGGGGKLPRIFVLAAGGTLIGAVLLYWDCGGDTIPGGIGESLTVVTADDTTGHSSAPIRSGDVEIAMAREELVPEKVTGAALDEDAASDQNLAEPEQLARQAKQQPELQPEQKSQAPAARQPATPPSNTRIEAKTSGSWAVQVGAFGDEKNARSLLTRLQDKNFPAKLRAGSKASGGIVYRVWIGFFSDRDEAEAYARQNRTELGETIAVHR